ncbi:HET-domain-containing protein [Hypoxylon fuscum]|nr:HET-domain-containing protein [Hypoxylon fuscum]
MPKHDIILSGKCAFSPRAECASFVSKKGEAVSHKHAIRLMGASGGSCCRVVNTDDDDHLHGPQLIIFTTFDLQGTQFEKFKIPKYTWTYRDSFFNASSNWARCRVSDCLQSHELCRRSRRDTSFLPSRLINVNAEEFGEDVVLESSALVAQGSPYVALSYCWGNHKPECMTTPDTVAKNTQRISWSTLPATFQDAVKFTRSLDINYLWIDSICIIQGDQNDWNKQSGKMFHIYRNAHVTLACLYGHTSTSGLRSMSAENQSMKVAELRLGQDYCPIYTRRPHYMGGHGNTDQDDIDLEEGTLLYRAWAYQERMISPRLLFFTESEIIFQCSSIPACECGEIGDRLAQPFHHKSEFFKNVVTTNVSTDHETPEPTRHLLTSNREGQQDRIAELWRNAILGQFSQLDLSLSRDRLPALSAIAEQFQRVRRDETYLAGLWSGSLVEDLLWYCKNSNTKEKQQKDALDRPYALPTWTWASLKSGIKYIPRTKDMAETVAIIKARCEYVDNNPFGVLRRSVLILRGRLLPCLVEWQGFNCDMLYLHSGEWTKFDKETLNDSIDYYMDHDDTGYQCIPQRQEVYLLEMTKMSTRHWWEGVRRYLILRREEIGKDIYSRVGILSYECEINISTRVEYMDSSVRSSKKKVFPKVFEERSVMTNCEIR